MALLVQKYGGSSLKDPEHIQRVAKNIAKNKQQGHQLVVVLSAMYNETNRLSKLATAITPNPEPREYDALLAAGEQISCALMSLALNQLGCTARSFNALQLGILTNDHHQNARILDIKTKRIHDLLKNDIIPIITGFQGINLLGDITTLGRGGSDISAVALACVLQADECQIFSDVEGVYTADPYKVPNAQLHPHIEYEQMLELAGLGAKVLHPRSVELAYRKELPIRLASSLNNKMGTLVTPHTSSLESMHLAGIACDANQILCTFLSIPYNAKIISKIMHQLAAAGIDIDMIVHNVAHSGKHLDVSLTVEKEERHRVESLLTSIASHLGPQCHLVTKPQVGKLSLVGIGLRKQPGVAADLLDALADININVHIMTSSEIKISVVIDEKYLNVAANRLHDIFSLSDQSPVLTII